MEIEWQQMFSSRSTGLRLLQIIMHLDGGRLPVINSKRNRKHSKLQWHEMNGDEEARCDHSSCDITINYLDIPYDEYI